MNHAMKLAPWLLPFALAACTPPGATPDDAGNNNNNNNDAGGQCDPDDVKRGVTVVVTDSVTSFRICNATVTAVDGEFTEDLLVFGGADDCEYFGLFDLSGSYTLTISAEDYGTATESTTVALDACDHAITQNLSFTLVPDDAPPPPADAGPDPVDAGNNPPVDAGNNPPVDAGNNPPEDAGQPGQDAGNDPVVDAGDAG